MPVTAQLVLGHGRGGTIEARAGEVVELGRAGLAALGMLQDPHMSARHFAIVCEADQCRLRDLGSTNGTFVNGARVTEALLRDGDRVEAGSSTFVVRVRHDTAPVTTAPVTDDTRSPAAPIVTKRAPEWSPAARAAAVVAAPGETQPPPPAIPLLQIANATPFRVATLPWEDLQGQARLSVIVKATFTIGAEARVASGQLPMFAADVVSEERPLSVRFETDLVPFKPHADVVLVGRAYAPHGHPVTQLVCGLGVGALRYGVSVFGDRVWTYQPLGLSAFSEPEPFVAMDLVYERAFGGIDGPGGMYCRENLVGTGFIGKLTRERVEGLRLPNLEDPRNLIRSWDTRPKLVGFAFYGRGWMPRLAYAGTYDEKYMKERHPLPPGDFSFRFFNGAHPDLHVEGYLRGDEDVVLLNVCPRDPEMRLRLPGIVPKITVARWTVPPDEWVEEHLGPDRELPTDLPLVDETVKPVLDTLVFIPDEGIFYEVFRGVCSLSSLDSLEIARISVTT